MTKLDITTESRHFVSNDYIDISVDEKGLVRSAGEYFGEIDTVVDETLEEWAEKANSNDIIRSDRYYRYLQLWRHFEQTGELPEKNILEFVELAAIKIIKDKYFNKK
jgi:hypothetical protein